MSNLEDVKFEISEDGKRISAKTDFSKNVDKMVKDYLLNGGKIAEIDALLNGGALVEVCTILGSPLYVRLDQRDPEAADHKLKEIRAIVKDVVLGNVD